MKFSRPIFLWLLPAVMVFMGTPLLEAQVSPTGKPVTIGGKITSFKNQELIVVAAGGEVRVKVPDAATIRGEVAVKLSDLTSGMYIGTVAQKQPDGTLRAVEVNIFSEEQRGVGEGHRPWTAGPNSTMTNANIEKVEQVEVQDVKGSILTLKYKGGEVNVFVPPDISMVKRIPVDREMLKAGVGVAIRATQTPDGTISASRITVGVGGLMPRS